MPFRLLLLGALLSVAACAPADAPLPTETDRPAPPETSATDEAPAPDDVAAAEPDCTSPPPLLGVPTGQRPFLLDGEDPEPLGASRLFNFGDVLLYSAGDAGYYAVMLWALDDCGLWIRTAHNPGYLDLHGEPAVPEFHLAPRRVDGSFRWREDGADVLAIEFQVQDRFRAVLMQDLSARP